MLHRLKFTNLFAATALIFLFITTAINPVMAEYPDKPIKLIIPTPPGGGFDRTIRTYIPFLEKQLGTNITPLNVRGGGGAVAWTRVVTGKADGYTIGAVHVPGIPITMTIANTRYGLSDFAHIGSINADATAIYVREDSPYKTYQDFIADARARPGKVTIGVASIRGHGPAIFDLEQIVGIDLNVVPFKGGGHTRKAVLGGQVPVGGQSLGSIARFLGKDLRALVQFSDKRADTAKNVPTTEEVGVNSTYVIIRSLAVSSKVPASILAKLQRAHKAAMQDPEWLAAARKAKIPVTYISGAQMKSHTASTLVSIDKLFNSVAELKKIIKK